MISRVLTQTSLSSTEPPNLWSGVEHPSIVPTPPRGTRVLRYKPGARPITSSSEKHTPLDEVCLTWLFACQVLVLKASPQVPIYDLAKPYDETCNKCGFGLSGARYVSSMSIPYANGSFNFTCRNVPHAPLTNSAPPASTVQKQTTRCTPSSTYPPKRTTWQVPNSPSSPPTLTHLQTSRNQHRATCNLCHQTIFGTCYKCLHPVCSSADVNLCSTCESDGGGMHPLDHPLLKLRTPGSWHPALGLGKPTCPSVPGSEEGRGAGVLRARESATPTSSSSEGAPSLRSLSGYGGSSWLGQGFHEAGLGLRPYGAAF
jgi:hypothetical protein